MKFLIAIVGLISTGAFAQDTLTLEQCLEMASADRIQVASEIASLQLAKTNLKYHPWTLLPNLSAGVGLNTSFGRRVDPFTNTFATNTVNSQTFSLNSVATLFNGFSYVYKRNVLSSNLLLGEITLQASQNNNLIRVAELYVELCKLTIQLEQSTIRIEKYEQIQRIQNLLIAGGRIDAVDTLRSHNSLLNEKLISANIISEIRIKNIDLNFLIGAPLSSDHRFIISSISEVATRFEFSEVFQLSQLENEIAIVDNQLKADRAMILPSLGFSGIVGTGFSTNNKDFSAAGNPTKRYNDQLQQNLYEGIGFYLSVPIFSRGSWLKTKQLAQIKRDELTQTKELSELQLERRKLEQQQRQIAKSAELEQTENIAKNLQLIYDKTVLLYEEGRDDYSELENAFLEWQTKVVAVETLKLEYQNLLLYGNK